MLDVAHNKLTALPDELPALGELRELDVSHNCLGTLAPTMCRLPQLARLRAADNKLRTLPRAIGELENLHTLVVSENSLEELVRRAAARRRLLAVRDSRHWRSRPRCLALRRCGASMWRSTASTACPCSRARCRRSSSWCCTTTR